MPKVNWKDKDDVIAFCKRVNSNPDRLKNTECIVIQYEGRVEYNVIPKRLHEVWDRSDVTVIYEGEGNETH